ncbi:hypothetical protein L7F22_003795 [Adiantum nelumboides]|nr:hypothetical protein [Adiantum nelumboides]
MSYRDLAKQLCQKLVLKKSPDSWQELFKDEHIEAIRAPAYHESELATCQSPSRGEPCDDSFALVDALLVDRAQLEELQPSLCLEVGCGSGYVITTLALILGNCNNYEVQFLATDVNEAAVHTTCSTLAAHHVNAEVVVADLVSGLEKLLDKVVDVLVFNPPYVPTPEDEVGVEGIASTWAGGDRGRTVIDRMPSIVDSLLSRNLLSRDCDRNQSWRDLPSHASQGVCLQNSRAALH